MPLPKDFTIRFGLNDEDWDFVLDLGKRVSHTSLSTIRQGVALHPEEGFARLVRMVRTLPDRHFIAEVSGERAAFMLLSDGIPDDVSLAPQLMLVYLAVEPRFERHGIGRALMEAAENLARDLGLPAISALVSAENIPSKTMCERLGYVVERVVLCKSLL